MQRMIAVILIFWWANFHAFAQQKIDSASAEKILIIREAQRYNYQDKDTLGMFVSLAGNTFVQQERTKFYADSMVINRRENSLEAFGNVHINDADSVHTYSQYLKYLGNEKMAHLKNKVKLTDGQGILTTNDLDYDTQFKIGKYYNGGKLVNNKTVLTSTEGYYYGGTHEAYFKKNVFLNDPDTKVYTDTLLYNIDSNVATFVCPTKIVQGKRITTTEDGFYNLKNKNGIFNKRPFVDDSSYTFTSDQMAYDDSTGLGEAAGNAVYKSKDSTNGYDLIANNIKINNKLEAYIATQKPILFIKQNRDTTYISADTLYSAKISLNQKNHPIPNIRNEIDSSIIIDSVSKFDSSTDRFFEAYHHVKIYSDSMQALCDSLLYSLHDSTIRLFTNPVLWANNVQLTGDTIYLLLENKQPQQLKVIENALSISREGEEYYNQVKGNTMNMFFKEGKINYIRTKGTPAENIYYSVDEHNKFIGVNRSTCDIIEAYFKNDTLQRVKFINNLDGSMKPMSQVNHKELRVRKFVWLNDIRPKSKFDIFMN
jgi:lipopolysaccharide export system protein LptA